VGYHSYGLYDQRPGALYRQTGTVRQKVDRLSRPQNRRDPRHKGRQRHQGGHDGAQISEKRRSPRAERAAPGELKGDFDLTRDSGTLYANTECGIFGKLSAEDAAKITGAALPIAKKNEIKTGRAAILATVSGNETREYDIEIEKIYSPSGSTRNLLLRVTDEELLAQTGGVVQGMSGSAILQDGKIIGAVTHVLLDDPSRGYGIFIENMLSAAGLSSE